MFDSIPTTIALSQQALGLFKDEYPKQFNAAMRIANKSLDKIDQNADKLAKGSLEEFFYWAILSTYTLIVTNNLDSRKEDN